MGAYERVTIAGVVLLSILSLTMMRIVDEENLSLRSEIQRRTQGQRVNPASHPIAGEDTAKRFKANQTVAQHNELLAVLEQLEKIAPDGVMIETISLNPDSKSYRIELRASEVNAVRRYLDKLNESKESKTWQIVSIEAQKQNAEWQAVLDMR